MNKLKSLISVLLIATGALFISCSDNTGQQNKSQITDTASVYVSDAETLPLLPIMVQLEQNMVALQSGIWREDFGTIERAAEAIAQHPKIQKRQIKRIRSILDDDEFRKFVQDDKKVHQTSVSVAKAAGNDSLEDVVTHTQALFEGCASCHQNHRNKIRNSEKWSITADIEE